MFSTPRFVIPNNTNNNNSSRPFHPTLSRQTKRVQWILLFFALLGIGWLILLQSGILFSQKKSITIASPPPLPDTTIITSIINEPIITTPVPPPKELLPSSTPSEEDVFLRGNSITISNNSHGNFFRHDVDDPLSNQLTGYPNKPWSLEQLALCAPKVNIVLKEGYECDSDPTCMKCVNDGLAERFRSLIGAFRDGNIETVRRSFIREKFPTMGQVIVVFAFNFAHSDLFLNWACSVEKLGLDPRTFTLVAPCDISSTELMKRTKFNYVPTEWLALLKHPIKSSESHWGSDHADINNIMLFLMNDLISMGYHVLVHDADIAWLKDPRPFLLQSSRRRDFIAMLAPFWTSMGPVNTGFLFLAPTQQLWVFLKSMENAAIIKGTSDQKLWNHILRHFTFQQLEWRLLPQEVVYKYSGRHAKKPGPEAIVVHALGGSKRQKLLYLNAWHLIEGKCSFYDKISAKLSQDELGKADKGAFANLLTTTGTTTTSATTTTTSAGTASNNNNGPS
jgi:hypothetical protein